MVSVGNSDNYLSGNETYWEKGYEAPNVDHHMFRFYGRILRPEFGLPNHHELLLDFGCGQGAAVNYFHMNGFNAEGVDISTTDLEIARHRFPHLSEKFSLCNPDPKAQGGYGTRSNYKVITAFQSLYYFTKADFEVLVSRLYDQLEPGGILFATMMGTSSEEFYSNSSPTDDPWLRRVSFSNQRLNVENYYLFFVEDEDDLVERFSLFKPVHVGYYAAKFRSDEGDGLHYTFCGVKD